jgi:hypothetical protein
VAGQSRPARVLPVASEPAVASTPASTVIAAITMTLSHSLGEGLTSMR